MTEEIEVGKTVEAGGVQDGVEAGGSLAPEVVALRARLLQADLRTEAARAGMVDLDGVKLIDLGGVKVDESGGVVDGAGVMGALRAAKPWLFGRSSSSSAAAPRAEPPRVKKATEMSLEEWRAARAELLKRR